MLEIAIKAAREAGNVLLEGCKGEIEVLERRRRDVKLAMDKRAEETIIKVLREAAPDYEILSEEAGRIGKSSHRQWVVDPLDGTYNYFRGIPDWVTSIALCDDGEEVLGVIYDPSRDEMFTAEKGGGAFLNDKPIHVSDTQTMADSIIALAYGAHDEFLDDMIKAMATVARCADKMRGLGSAAMHLAYVACGRLDAFFEFGLWPWDVAAGVVMIREAGGRVAIRRNGDLPLEILCSNGRIHAESTNRIGWCDT